MVSLHPCILLLREHILLNKMQSLLQQQLFSNDCQTTANFDLFINTELFDSYSNKNWFILLCMQLVSHFSPQILTVFTFFSRQQLLLHFIKDNSGFSFFPRQQFFFFPPIQYRQLLIWFHHEHDCCLILPRLRMIFVAL